MATGVHNIRQSGLGLMLFSTRALSASICLRGKIPQLLTQITHRPERKARVKMGSFYHKINKVKATSKEGAVLC